MAASKFEGGYTVAAKMRECELCLVGVRAKKCEAKAKVRSGRGVGIGGALGREIRAVDKCAPTWPCKCEG